MESATTPQPGTEAESQAESRLPRGDRPYGLLLSTLGGTTMGGFRRALKPLELSAHHYIVLKQLAILGTASQASLAESLGIDYSNMATLTGQLAERELIERYRHERDKRRYVVELSAKGAKLVDEADKAVAEGQDKLIEPLDPEEREQLLALLEKVADAANLCPRGAGDNCNLKDTEGSC